METKHITASEVKSGDKIVFIGNNNKKVIIGTVEKIYKMVDNQLQFRFLKGGIFSAITYNNFDDVMVTA